MKRAYLAITIALSTLTALPSKALSSDAYGLVQTAREAARADNHDESIAAFQRAVVAEPQRRHEWLVELADQYTWSGQLTAAILLYREAIQTVASDQQRRARIGLARAQNWRGRHRDAALLTRALLADYPNDREATAILAEALTWMGRTDRAERVLREQIAADADDRRASELLEGLKVEQRPELRVDWREFSQSDNLEISELALATRFYFSDGRGFLIPRYSLTTYQPETGPVQEIKVQRPGIESHYRITDSLDWHGSVFVDQINTYGAVGDHDLTTYGTYFTYWPSDVVRVDLGSSRWTFDSEQALREGRNATQVSASMDILPNDRTRLSARASQADYSDSNKRSWWQLQVDHRLGSNPRISAGYRYTNFDFTLPWQRGYYSPDRYQSHEALLQASGWGGSVFYWDIRMAVGRETETPGTSRVIQSGGASVSVKVQPQLYLEAAYDRSSSSTEAMSSGFERSVTRLTLRQRF